MADLINPYTVKLNESSNQLKPSEVKTDVGWVSNQPDNYDLDQFIKRRFQSEKDGLNYGVDNTELYIGTGVAAGMTGMRYLRNKQMIPRSFSRNNGPVGFASGASAYNQPKGVWKGVGSHLTRNAGRYIEGAYALGSAAYLGYLYFNPELNLAKKAYSLNVDKDVIKGLDLTILLAKDSANQAQSVRFEINGDGTISEQIKESVTGSSSSKDNDHNSLMAKSKTRQTVKEFDHEQAVVDLGDLLSMEMADDNASNVSKILGFLTESYLKTTSKSKGMTEAVIKDYLPSLLAHSNKDIANAAKELERIISPQVIGESIETKPLIAEASIEVPEPVKINAEAQVLLDKLASVSHDNNDTMTPSLKAAISRLIKDGNNQLLSQLVDNAVNYDDIKEELCNLNEQIKSRAKQKPEAFEQSLQTILGVLRK